MIDADHITREIERQKQDFHRKCVEPMFVILDKLSYLALDQSFHHRFGTAPFDFNPPLGHFHKVYGLIVVVVGIGHKIEVVAAPYDEAMR